MVSMLLKHSTNLRMVVIQIKSIRCKYCGKLLGKFDGRGEVKCTRSSCGALNTFNTVTNEHKARCYENSDLSKRKTSSGVTFR